jgi:hypothetical protein
VVAYLPECDVVSFHCQFPDNCVHCHEYISSSAAYKEAVIMGKVIGTEYDYSKLPPFRKLCEAAALLQKPDFDFNNQVDRFILR